MSKKIAILQPNYIPWKGYFDIINSVDEFILLEEVQFTKRDWRNRNLIKTPIGKKWLTIPVKQKGSRQLNISDIKISDQNWGIKHWNQLLQHYKKAKYFYHYADSIYSLYHQNSTDLLIEINYKFIKQINSILGINTRISRSQSYQSEGKKSSKLIDLCKAAGANHYLSGPSAKNYLDTALFEKEGIRVEWMDYSEYPQYEQLFPPFDHQVTILDLLFNEGPHTIDYMKCFKMS